MTVGTYHTVANAEVIVERGRMAPNTLYIRNELPFEEGSSEYSKIMLKHDFSFV